MPIDKIYKYLKLFPIFFQKTILFLHKILLDKSSSEAISNSFSYSRFLLLFGLILPNMTRRGYLAKGQQHSEGQFHETAGPSTATASKGECSYSAEVDTNKPV